MWHFRKKRPYRLSPSMWHSASSTFWLASLLSGPFSTSWCCVSWPWMRKTRRGTLSTGRCSITTGSPASIPQTQPPLLVASETSTLRCSTSNPCAPACGTRAVRSYSTQSLWLYPGICPRQTLVSSRVTTRLAVMLIAHPTDAFATHSTLASALCQQACIASLAFGDSWSEGAPYSLKWNLLLLNWAGRNKNIVWHLHSSP